MKASIAMGTLAFIVLGSTSADAHKLEQVRRQLMSQGYDQIEFTQTKAPYAVDACRGSKRLHLHVDWYGKVTETNDTPTGSCPTEAVNTIETEAEPKNEPKTTKTQAEIENSSISAAPREGLKLFKDNAVKTEAKQGRGRDRLQKVRPRRRQDGHGSLRVMFSDASRKMLHCALHNGWFALRRGESPGKKVAPIVVPP